MLCLPYRCSASLGDEDPKNQWRSVEELVKGGCVAHVFEEGWVPKYLIANGKKKRRNCVVVEEGKSQWKVFDLEGFRSGEVGAYLGESDGDDEESKVFD